MNDIFKILGGYTIVLTALIAFLGKIWVSRIIERSKTELQKELSLVKEDLGRRTKVLEAELQKSVHVDKAKFDHEYDIYKSIWAALVELKLVTLNLRPSLDYIDPTESKEDRAKRKLMAFGEKFVHYRGV